MLHGNGGRERLIEEQCVLCVEGGEKGWKEGKEQKESRERREGERVGDGQATARQPGRVARLQHGWESALTKIIVLTKSYG